MRKFFFVLLLFQFLLYPIFAQSDQTDINVTTLINIVLIVLIIGLFVVIIVLLIKRQKVEENPKYIELKGNMEHERKEKNTLQGTNNQLSQENARLQADNSQKQQKIDELHQKVAKYENAEEQRQTEFNKKVDDLDNSRKALEGEKNRVIKEDEEKKKQEEENRDRIWNLHEQESISKMVEICHKPGLSFICYDNKNLPEDFDNSLKPDFLVEFLGQYIIFDPKLSKSQSIQTYISTQVKSTARKIKTSSSFPDIYNTVFFIIPSIEVQNIKTYSYLEEGISFYVIPIEAFEPIICIFKKLKDYDLADKYDPQEREKVINMIASFDNHIRHQNATNILNTVRGLKILKERENMPEDIIEAVETKRKSIRIENFKLTELKKLISNPDEQIKEVVKIIQPHLAELSEDDIKKAQDSNP